MLVGVTTATSIAADLALGAIKDSNTLPFAVSGFTQATICSLVAYIGLGGSYSHSEGRLCKYLSWAPVGLCTTALAALAYYKVGFLALPIVPLFNIITKEACKEVPCVYLGAGCVEILGSTAVALIGGLIKERKLVDAAFCISILGASNIGFAGKEEKNFDFSELKYPMLAGVSISSLCGMIGGTFSGTSIGGSLVEMITTAATASGVATASLVAGAGLGYLCYSLAEKISSCECVKSCFSAIGGCFQKTWSCIWG